MLYFRHPFPKFPTPWRCAAWHLLFNRQPALQVRERNLAEERYQYRPAVGRQPLSESLYRPLIDHAMPDALFVSDCGGRVVEVNARACDSLGYTKTELLAMSIPDFEQDLDLAAILEINHALKPGMTRRLYGHHRRKDGRAFPVEIHVGCHETGGKHLFLSIVRDISERWRAEEALRHSEERFRRIYEYAPIGISIGDQSGRFLQCNPAFCQLIGYSEEELRSKVFSSLVHPDDREANLIEVERLKAGEVSHFDIENRYVRKDGSSVWVEKFVSLLPGENGNPGLLIALLNDITARKTFETALAEREEQYRAVIETAADGFWMVDDAGYLLAVNEAYVRRSGYRREELLGQNIAALEARESSPEVGCHIGNIRRNGSDLFETWHRTKSGERWPVEVNASYWAAAGGRFFVFLRDISERKQAAAALQESEARFRATFEQAAVGIAHVAPDGRWLRVNKKLCEILGYSQQELLAQKFADITHPGDIETSLALVQRMLAGETPTLVAEKRYIHKNGSTIYANLTVALTRKADGSPDYFITVIEDISERKRTEAALQAMHAEMEHLTRFQVANQTAAAFAHELNQPLNAVASYAEAALRLLRVGNPRPEKLIHAIENSAQQAQRAGRVVRELLAFMNQNEVQTELLCLNTLVRDILVRIEADGFSTANFRLELDPALPPVTANRLQVEKVLVNLIENSIEAMREAGISAQAITVTVRTGADDVMAQVTITDRGPGIDRQTLHRIFEPFFSTKPKGLGMGLAISRAIIEAHGGQLWVDSEAGAGASFHFTLPFAA
ncbi:PAS domain S-box protein [Propionivibrio limicola]|uniref:PAS domain S-box protein n=1 Tax=Propionivibrio limicola TaxID=167645 RepID=UPI001478DB36|nr:PAS domain S-box protein [Propionivibrio limicola]